jgi:hypothetical protein
MTVTEGVSEMTVVNKKGPLGMEVTAKPTVEGEEIQLRLTAVGIVRAEHVELEKGMAGLILAGKEARIERAGARTIVSGGDTSVTQGGAGMILSAGATTISRGGAGTIASLGNIDLEKSGGALLVSKEATVGRDGFVAVAMAPRLTVQEGGRVLLEGRYLFAVLGAALVAFLVGRMLPRRQKQPEVAE